MSADDDHGHEHDHDEEHSDLDPMDVRVRALETLLTEKGYIDPAALDELIDAYQTRIGPQNGARVVARAWVDPDFRERLRLDATEAIASLGYGGRQGEHMVAVEQTDRTHHLVVCTLCSCYPWPVLGLPPTWYKSAPYRSRVVRDPRGVLAEFGVTVDDGVDVRVWDSTAEVRYLVIPQRPSGTDGWTEEQLASLVTRDSMIGVGLPLDPGGLDPGAIDPGGLDPGGFDAGGLDAGGLDPNGAVAVSAGDTGPYVSHADLGGAAGHQPIEPEPAGVVFHHRWQAKALALTLAAGASGRWNIDMSRRYRETLPDYAALTYYEIWTAGLERLLVERGLVTDDELAAGHALDDPAEVAGVLTSEQVGAVLATGAPVDREPPSPARFAVGDRVLTRAGRVDHHTRLPGYVAGRVGTIERTHGAHVFPDTNAHDLGEQPRWLYTVVFDATDLWADAAPGDHVSIDAWEPYLSPAVDGER